MSKLDELDKIHKIMQEEIADRVGYQDKFCELALSRGLESAESRLSTLIHFVRADASQQARLEERQALKNKLMIMHDQVKVGNVELSMAILDFLSTLNNKN